MVSSQWGSLCVFPYSGTVPKCTNAVSGDYVDWTQDQISEDARQLIKQNYYGLELATIESITNGNSVEQKQMLKDMADPDVPFNPKQFRVRTFVAHSLQTLYGFSTTASGSSTTRKLALRGSSTTRLICACIPHACYWQLCYSVCDDLSSDISALSLL